MKAAKTLWVVLVGCCLTVGLTVTASAGAGAGAGESEGETVILHDDFSEATVGDVPAAYLVLDGLFEVKEEGSNRYLELPGAPLETFGVLFGPNERSGMDVRASFRGSRTGRKYPTFMLGLNGVNGYKLRVAPAKNALELVKGEEVIDRVPFKWESGEWMSARLCVMPEGEGVKLKAKAWQGSEEPEQWLVEAIQEKGLPQGKAGVWGLPFSGTPIQFDDIKLVRVGGNKL